jgi:hypothetical protein
MKMFVGKRRTVSGGIPGWRSLKLRAIQVLWDVFGYEYLLNPWVRRSAVLQITKALHLLLKPPALQVSLLKNSRLSVGLLLTTFFTAKTQKPWSFPITFS